MIALVVLLSVGLGLSLGLLGGGGSILAVPLLIYVAGIAPKAAIATSLIVVGVTSAVAALLHGRRGNVRMKTGVVFGAAGMLGAYFGARSAVFVPDIVLLIAFALVMIVAALAMMRDRAEVESTEPRLVKAAAEGLVVGAVTGLLGAGGGFVVVPALVLLGGLNTRDAVGTSAMVIAMKSVAGFAGYAAHVSVDLRLAAMVTAGAVVGAVIGALWSRRLAVHTLRRTFAVMVAGIGIAMLIAELPESARAALLETRWSFWAAGAAIGLFVLVFRRFTGRALGVSTGFVDACAAPSEPAARRSWRLPFLVGIVGGGAVAAALAGQLPMGAAPDRFDALFALSTPAKALVLGSAGVLLGFGARLAGGCTSGHGIVGMAVNLRGLLGRDTPKLASMMATAAFMAVGVVVTHALVAWLGA